MSTIKSSAENLTLNADGANNDIKFQSNGSEVASIDQAGVMTATSFAGSGANLTGITDTSGLTSQQVFTSSGTWTKPTGITKVKVYVTAGGGAGGSSHNPYTMGGGGAAGGTAIEIIDVSSVSSVTVTIGAGGDSNGAGSSSSFGSYCSATGGTGGIRGSTDSFHTIGGVGTGGDINLYGGDGTNGGGLDSASKPTGNNGGASFWGGGGASGTRTNSDTDTYRNGHAGLAYGSGGGGGTEDAGLGHAGGAGKAGICVVEEYK